KKGCMERLSVCIQANQNANNSFKRHVLLNHFTPMKRYIIVAVLACLGLKWNLVKSQNLPVQEKGIIQDYVSHPVPSALTGSDSKLAWVLYEEGRRNVYVAEAPQYAHRKLTDYRADDGQDLTSLSIS